MEKSISLKEEERQEMYNAIYDDSMWLVNLTENLLSITRIQDGTMPLKKREEMLEEVAGDAVLTTRRRFPDANVQLDLSEDILFLPMEPMLIKQVIVNLLENAVEELSRGEHDLKEIRLALYCRPDCNVIVCEDTGGGVDPEIQPHIFEKGVSSKGEGRGLGLCLIHQLVEQHHGTIDVMTEAGAGTCFTLTFTDSVPEEA